MISPILTSSTYFNNLRAKLAPNADIETEHSLASPAQGQPGSGGIRPNRKQEAMASAMGGRTE